MFMLLRFKYFLKLFKEGLFCISLGNFTLINMMKCTLSDFPYPGILSEVSNSQKGRKKDKLRQKQQSLGKTTTFGSLRYRKKSLINLSYFLDDSSGHVHVVS